MDEKRLRQRAQELSDMSRWTDEELTEFVTIRKKLIEEYGWSRGKKLSNGHYSYLEK